MLLPSLDADRAQVIAEQVDIDVIDAQACLDDSARWAQETGADDAALDALVDQLARVAGVSVDALLDEFLRVHAALHGGVVGDVNLLGDPSLN